MFAYRNLLFTYRDSMQTEIYRPSRYVQSSAEKSSVSNCNRFECGRVDRKRWLKMILKHLANGCFRRSYMYGSRKQKKKRMPMCFFLFCASMFILYFRCEFTWYICFRQFFSATFLLILWFPCRKKIHPYLKWCLYVDTFCYINIGLISVLKFQIGACSSAFFFC